MTTTTSMIKNPFDMSSSKDGEFPRDVKDAVSKLRASVQDALGKRISRMDIELPVGAKFGVEKTANKQKSKRGRALMDDGDDQSSVSEGDVSVTLADLQKSDRELARIFVEMFQPLGGENIAVCFNDPDQADAAKAAWKGDSAASSRIFSLSSGGKRKSSASKKKKQKSKGGGGMGFAAKMAAALDEDLDGTSLSGYGGSFSLPETIELALFVAPGPKELIVVEGICNKVGMGTLVVLLNARLSSETASKQQPKFATDSARQLFMEEFEPVFSLCAAPQDVAPGCLLHRAYPNDWMMARKPKVGPPKVVLTQGERPTKDDCEKAHDSIEVSEMENAVESVLDGVVGWFR